MDFKEFIRWEETNYDTLKVKRIYIDIAGDLVAGMLLSQIIYWHLPSKSGKTRLQVMKNGQLWLAKGREDWWDECRITARQFDRAIAVLEEKGFVEKQLFRFDGSPTVHIRLVPEVLMIRIETEMDGQREIHFNESVKSIFTKGENPPSRNGKNITEITTETTTETTVGGQPSDLPSTTAEEKEILRIIRSVPNYPFDYAKDLEHIRALSLDFPDVDILDETKKWATWLLDKPLKPRSNPRLRLRNWMVNARKYRKEAGARGGISSGKGTGEWAELYE